MLDCGTAAGEATVPKSHNQLWVLWFPSRKHQPENGWERLIPPPRPKHLFEHIAPRKVYLQSAILQIMAPQVSF